LIKNNALKYYSRALKENKLFFPGANIIIL